MSLSDVIGKARPAFIPFITAGDPSLAATRRFVSMLSREGAAVVELGVPFSDPVADGPVIQAAAERALKNGASLAGVLGALRGLRDDGETVPVILFTYLNPAWRMGLERFAEAAARAGAQGALVVDLPAESAGPWRRALAKRGLELVLLASPTTSDARLKVIARSGGSIVYYVSREGVTGARRGLPPGLAARLAHVRKVVRKPLIVGFGISGGKQARALAGHADGIVVGSALVAAAAGKAPEAGERAMRRVARDVMKGLNGC